MSLRSWPPTWLRRLSPDRAPSAPDGCVALGSGSAAAIGAAPKGQLVDRASAAGIDVPRGFVVPHGVHAPGPDAVTRWAGGPTVGLAVRSAFGAEDGSESSLAGWFTSRLDVRPHEFAEALTEVRSSARRRTGEFRLDVLVMAMVEARHAGVAFSEPGTYDDVANVTAGLADRLVSGVVEGERVLIPRLEHAPDGWPERLRTLLADVRSEFGDAAWDIEWADDGKVCWLVQIRPITRPTVRNETLTAANHAEILPRLPSQLMTSIVAEAGPDLFEWYRQRVPGLPAERDFLHVVEGRPMINLSLLEDMMRHLGLPTAMVAESIGGESASTTGGDDRALAPLRVVRRSPSLVRLGVAQIVAVARSGSNRRRAAAIGADGAASFTEAVDDLHRSYVALVTGMFPLSSAIGPPLGALRAAGTLFEHAARNRTVTVELAERRATLRRAQPGERDAALAAFLNDFGHRGVYESDIARPRYGDDPATLTDVAERDDPVGRSPRPPARTWRGRLTIPVWLAAQGPMRARELLRHDAMRSFHSIRQSLVRLGERAVTEGRLRSVDDLWMLDADEVRALDTGWTPGDGFWERRADERARLERLDVPHVVRRFDDPADWRHDDGDGPLRGLPLTEGRVSGVAWVCDEPPTTMPEGFEPSSTILVARSIDAGWISTISLVAAVIVEIGGDLSHGSILVRELGLPAITNVRGATRRIATGDELVIDAAAGTVRSV
ncbi:MAG: PEP-utilizing enzyme [Ilumatobacter sp.]